MIATALFFKAPRMPLCVGLVAALVGSTSAMAQTFIITNITVPNSASVSVSALNGSGHVAGYFYTPNSEQRAFFWADGAATDLLTLGGSLSVANHLNEFDQVAGYAAIVADTEYHAFSSVGRTLFDLGTLGGPVSTANSISDGGHVTGYSWISPFSVDYHAFLVVNNGVMQDLGTLGGSTSSGTAVNNAGQIVGDSATTGDAENHAFFYNGTMHDLGTLGGTSSSATALSESGLATGQSTLAGESETHAFLFDGTAMRDLRTLGGIYSAGYDINDAGQVIGDSTLAGEAEYHGFIYSNNSMQDLGSLGGGFSSASAINNAGQVVGVSSNGTGQLHAFLWVNGTMLDLNSLLPPNSGWQLTGAHFINDAGQIVGVGVYQGQSTWFLLTPHVQDNQPPVAQAGADQNVGATEATALVTLDGTQSSDPDGDELSYDWLENGVSLGRGARATFALALGTHTITLRVTDTQEASAEDTVVVVVRDVGPPTVECPGDQSASANERGLAAVPDLLANLVARDNGTDASALRKSQTPAAGTVVVCGGYTITITVTDAAGNVARCDVAFTVSDTTPPTVQCAAPITRRSGTNGAVVPNLALYTRASDNCTPASALLFAQDPAPGTRLGLGDHELRLSVTDQAGNTTVCTVLFHVIDLCPPRIRSLTADPNILTPANHQMVDVTLTAVVTDNADCNPVCRIDSVTSNEPVTSQTDHTSPDWEITGNLTLQLRAEVDTREVGRVYKIRVACTDAAGNTCYKNVCVRVPKNRKVGEDATATATATR